MQDFQAYQNTFTAHIRDPENNAKPTQVDDHRMGVYREIVFNNLVSTVTSCFPVCKKILGDDVWQSLCRTFFANHQSKTPIFREIPQAFLDFLNTQTELPDYMTALAHYEWVELALANMPDVPLNINEACDVLNDAIQLNPSHRLMEYAYPVHQISHAIQPDAPETTHLLIFRKVDYHIQFIVLNPITYQLLLLIKQGQTGKQALTLIAEHLHHPEPDSIIQFGKEILDDLHKQQAIMLD